jgi:hypothetical protein
MEKKDKRTEELDHEGWISDQAFFVDVAGHLDTLNKELQAKEKLITEIFNNIMALKVKLCLWENQLKVHNLVHFPHLKSLEIIFHELFFRNISGAFFCYKRISANGSMTSKLWNWIFFFF